MKKINKTKILSTVYKKWENKLEEHPKYNNSKVRKEIYIDIATNLLNIQGGLCAYTEIFLCNKNIVDDNNWKAGRFKKQNITIKDICKGGGLDHFDASIKKEKAWLWDNFFFVDTDVNNKKSDKEVDSILKPDTKDYDEYKLLEYNIDEHIFIANTGLDIQTQKRVNNMILTLGINQVKNVRKEYLEEKILDIELKYKTWEQTSVFQFLTAFEMCKITMNNEKI